MDNSMMPKKMRPRRIDPMEAATPPEMGEDEVEARRPRIRPAPSMTPSPANQRRMAEQLRDQQMMEDMDRASETSRRSSMGTLKPGKAYAKGGSVSSASKRADGCAQRGKTRGKFV
jgi:hypothetical protein